MTPDPVVPQEPVPHDHAGFTCPLCKCESYVGVTVALSDGRTFTTDLFQCARCTLTFMDPRRFHRYAAGSADAPGRERDATP